MKLRECFNAMQEPYKSAAYEEIDNERLLNSEAGKISDAVFVFIMSGLDPIKKPFWSAYRESLLKMGL